MADLFEAAGLTPQAPSPLADRLRPQTLSEVQEIQRRLTALGFDTGGADGRAGLDTLRAAKTYQQKVGFEPADGYPGVRLLERLRQGG